MSKEEQQTTVALSYQRSAKIQAVLRRDLLEFSSAVFNTFTPNFILDLGCGAGFSTQSLQRRFSESQILGVDCQEALLAFAQSQTLGSRISFMNARFSDFFFPTGIDTVFSFSALHWLTDAEVTLDRWVSSLSSKAVFAAAIFGPETYSELALSLSDVLGQPILLQAGHFLPLSHWSLLFKQRFLHVNSVRRVYRQEFDSVLGLFRAIQETQVRGVGLEGVSWTKGFLAELERAYRCRFSRIWASYEILLISATGAGEGER